MQPIGIGRASLRFSFRVAHVGEELGLAKYSKVVHIPLSKETSPNISESLRFSFINADGVPSGQPQKSGCSRHSKVIHCPA